MGSEQRCPTMRTYHAHVNWAALAVRCWPVWGWCRSAHPPSSLHRWCCRWQLPLRIAIEMARAADEAQACQEFSDGTFPDVEVNSSSSGCNNCRRNGIHDSKCWSCASCVARCGAGCVGNCASRTTCPRASTTTHGCGCHCCSCCSIAAIGVCAC